MSLLTGIIFYLRSMLIKARIQTMYQYKLWRTFNICAYLSCLGMIGVAAISIYTEIITHLVFAFMLFISGIVIMFVSTLLDISLKLPLTRTLRIIRYVLTGTAIFSGILLGFTFVPYPFIGSMCEIIASTSMTFYIATFSYKLESVESPIVKEWDHIQHLADDQSRSADSFRKRIV